jgi:hypothetical protein
MHDHPRVFGEHAAVILSITAVLTTESCNYFLSENGNATDTISVNLLDLHTTRLHRFLFSAIVILFAPKPLALRGTCSGKSL